ncbi:hypothetical protein F2P81_006681 [Scophthalmus maximus]|uniref:Uncharacterized protein n=1 Tax=Scophthalmus maximus TaxID=52904 RepID=A0A6A4T410_SCOMX|nr:hypothetical protein F2P81_006681 [Scophthalmus maximus]
MSNTRTSEAESSGVTMVVTIPGRRHSNVPVADLQLSAVVGSVALLPWQRTGELSVCTVGVLRFKFCKNSFCRRRFCSFLRCSSSYERRSRSFINSHFWERNNTTRRREEIDQMDFVMVFASRCSQDTSYVCESSTGDVIAAGGGRLLQETVMHYDMSASEHDSGSDRNHTSGLHQFTSTDETHSQQLLDGIRFVQKITNDNESIQTNKTQLKQGQTSVVGRRLCGSHLSSEVLDVRRRRVHVWSILQENDSTRSRSSPLYQTSGRVNHLVRFPRWFDVTLLVLRSRGYETSAGTGSSDMLIHSFPSRCEQTDAELTHVSEARQTSPSAAFQSLFVCGAKVQRRAENVMMEVDVRTEDRESYTEHVAHFQAAGEETRRRGDEEARRGDEEVKRRRRGEEARRRGDEETRRRDEETRRRGGEEARQGDEETRRRDEETRRRRGEETRRRGDEEARRGDEEAKRRRRGEETRRRGDEEARRRGDEETRRRGGETRRRGGEEETKRRGDEEARRGDEEAKRRGDEETRRRGGETRRRGGEEARRRGDEETRRRDEETRRRRGEETRRRGDEEARRGDEEAKRRGDEETRRRGGETRRRGGEEARRRGDEETRRRDEETRRRRGEETRRRGDEEARRGDEEAKRRGDEETRRRGGETRRRGGEEARRRGDEETRRRDEETRRGGEEEAKRRRRGEETRRRRGEPVTYTTSSCTNIRWFRALWRPLLVSSSNHHVHLTNAFLSRRFSRLHSSDDVPTRRRAAERRRSVNVSQADVRSHSRTDSYLESTPSSPPALWLQLRSSLEATVENVIMRISSDSLRYGQKLDGECPSAAPGTDRRYEQKWDEEVKDGGRLVADTSSLIVLSTGGNIESTAAPAGGSAEETSEDEGVHIAASSEDQRRRRRCSSRLVYSQTTSDLGPLTSDLRPRTSDLRPPTSDLRPQTSDLRPPTSDLGPRTSDHGPLTSDLGPRTSDLRPRTSDLGPRTSDL